MKVKQSIHVHKRLLGSSQVVFPHYHTILSLICIFIPKCFLSSGPPEALSPQYNQGN